MGEESKVRGNVCCRRASPGQTVCQAIDGPEIEGDGMGVWGRHKRGAESDMFIMSPEEGLRHNMIHALAAGQVGEAPGLHGIGYLYLKNAFGSILPGPVFLGCPIL